MTCVFADRLCRSSLKSLVFSWLTLCLVNPPLWTSVLNKANPMASRLRSILLVRHPASQLNIAGSNFYPHLLEILPIYSGLGSPLRPFRLHASSYFQYWLSLVSQYDHWFLHTRPVRVNTCPAPARVTDRFHSPVSSMVTKKAKPRERGHISRSGRLQNLFCITLI